MKPIILIVVLILVGHLGLLSTAQYPDAIIYEGKEYALHSNPMEAYFEKFPDKKPNGGLISSALWRGYVATFVVEEDILYLKDIEIQVRSEESSEDFLETEWKSVIEEVQDGEERIMIDWTTGILVLPFGEMVNYVHLGYGSEYSNYILLEVDEGHVKRSKKLKGDEYIKFKEKQFKAFKKTEKYKTLVEDLKKDGGYDDAFIESFLQDFVIEYTSMFLVEK